MKKLVNQKTGKKLFQNCLPTAVFNFAPLKKQIRELDKKIEKLSTRKAQLEQQLLVQYSADGSIELALLTDELNKCEEEWLALNEQCEALLHAD